MNAQPPSPQTKRFVLCFSPKDADGKAELVAHLSPVRGTLTSWSVDEVRAGESVAASFRRAAADADAAVLLLSSDFFSELDEPAFAEQVRQLREQQTARGLTLMPVLWREVNWQAVSWLSGCKPLPSGRTALRSMGKRRRDQALAEVARQLDGRIPHFSGRTKRTIAVSSSLGLAAMLVISSLIIAAIRFYYENEAISVSYPASPDKDKKAYFIIKDGIRHRVPSPTIIDYLYPNKHRINVHQWVAKLFSEGAPCKYENGMLVKHYYCTGACARYVILDNELISLSGVMTSQELLNEYDCDDSQAVEMHPEDTSLLRSHNRRLLKKQDESGAAKTMKCLKPGASVDQDCW